MSVTEVRKDTDQLTMTMVAEYDVTAERAWQLWGDPRQLERWWGPPTYPATFVDHDLRPGARVTYFMTGPTGDQPQGLWEVQEVDPPRSLVFLELFADNNGNPNPDLPAYATGLTWTAQGAYRPYQYPAGANNAVWKATLKTSSGPEEGFTWFRPRMLVAPGS